MSATIEIGDNKDSIVMIVPSGFIDDIFDVIKRDLPSNRNAIIENLRDGYAESTYLDFTSLNAEAFKEIKGILLDYHRNHLEDQVNLLGVFSASRLGLMNSLKAGILVDGRDPHLDKVLLKNKTHEIGVESWWFQFVLETLVVSINQLDQKRLIYNLWLSKIDTHQLEPIADILSEEMEHFKLHNIYNSYLKEKHEEYLRDLSQLMGYTS